MRVKYLTKEEGARVGISRYTYIITFRTRRRYNYTGRAVRCTNKIYFDVDEAIYKLAKR